MPGRRSFWRRPRSSSPRSLGGCDSDGDSGPDRRPHRLPGAVPRLRGRAALGRRAPVPRPRRAPRGNGAERRGHRDRGRRSAGRARSRLPGDRRAHGLHRGGPAAARDGARRRGRRRRVGGDARPRAAVSRCAVREHVLGRAGGHLAPSRPRTSSASRPTYAQQAAGLGAYAYRELGWRRAAVVAGDQPSGWARRGRIHRRVLRARWTGRRRRRTARCSRAGPIVVARSLAAKPDGVATFLNFLDDPATVLELVGVGARRSAATPRLGSDPRGPRAPAGARRQARRRRRHDVAPVGSRVAPSSRDYRRRYRAAFPGLPAFLARPVHGARVPQRRRGDPQTRSSESIRQTSARG